MKSKKINSGGTDPKGFDSIVREVFAPIYPVISQQIISKTGKSDGECLDLGCGTGALGRALASLCDMNVTYYDQSSEMLELSASYANSERLVNRSKFVCGDVHDLSLNDNVMDLVVSRGSIPFWDDLNKAFSEILRVLKNGGHAYIGGGFGNEKLRTEIVEAMNKRDGGWRNSAKDKFKQKQELLPKIINKLNASKTQIIEDESGYWIHIIK
jgi:ubiquinone/menaquinone biosynthesis C-methylase UbiE